MGTVKLFDNHPARRAIADALEQRGTDMAALSKALGRNHAYIQQFLTRGTPAELKERDRRAVAQFLRIDERALLSDSDVRELTYVPLDADGIAEDIRDRQQRGSLPDDGDAIALADH